MDQHGPLATRYVNALAALFSGDSAGFGACWAEDCNIVSEAGRTHGRDKWVKFCETARDQYGWTAQEVDSSSEADGVVAMFGRNVYANGKSSAVGGLVRFNDDGQIVLAMSIGGNA